MHGTDGRSAGTSRRDGPPPLRADASGAAVAVLQRVVEIRRDNVARGLGFDRPVAPGGYAWWYVDALSDDARHGITLIAFVGSVFSPYYAWARGRSGIAEPLNHCSLNVALYGEGGKRWAMTERNASTLRRASSWLTIGPSSLLWDGSALTIQINEVTAPLPGRIRGQVRVYPTALGCQSFALDGQARHRWQPIAPCARVEVSLQRPGLRWSGPGYLDQNNGDEPLEAAFARWDWSRAPLRRSTAILYDITRRDGATGSLALRADPSGEVESFDPPPAASLPRTFWRVSRTTRAEGGASVRETLEDGPFYARSLLSSRLLGEDVTAMHESLSLDRFRKPWVRMMLPFRMPRRVW